MQKKNIYGYAVGYRELGSRFIRYFTDFTYRSAQQSLRIYQKYPQQERETNRPLVDPVWEIQPITKKEVMRAILDEIPFPKHRLFLFYLDFYRFSRKIFHFLIKVPFLFMPITFLCSLGLSSHRCNPKVNARKIFCLSTIYV